MAECLQSIGERHGLIDLGWSESLYRALILSVALAACEIDKKLRDESSIGQVRRASLRGDPTTSRTAQDRELRDAWEAVDMAAVAYSSFSNTTKQSHIGFDHD